MTCLRSEREAVMRNISLSFASYLPNLGPTTSSLLTILPMLTASLRIFVREKQERVVITSTAQSLRPPCPATLISVAEDQSIAA